MRRLPDGSLEGTSQELAEYARLTATTVRADYERIENALLGEVLRATKPELVTSPASVARVEEISKAQKVCRTDDAGRFDKPRGKPRGRAVSKKFKHYSNDEALYLLRHYKFLGVDTNNRYECLRNNNVIAKKLMRGGKDASKRMSNYVSYLFDERPEFVLNAIGQERFDMYMELRRKRGIARWGQK